MSFSLILRHSGDKCYVIRGCITFQGMYYAQRWILYLKGRITCRNGYYFEDRIARRDGSIENFSPMGPELRDNECVLLG